MKAIRWYGRRDLRYEDIAEPSPGAGQLKVKVNLVGICGTDLKEYTSGPVMIPAGRSPLVLGHEFAGTVAEVGEGVSDFRVGERVTGVGYWYCGECYYCRRGLVNICLKWEFTGLTVDGCLAEYCILPAYACYRVPDNVSDEAATLVEPLAVAIHTIRQGRVSAGDTVAVVGDGTIGLLAVIAARMAGAEVYLVAKHKGRGELAKGFGAAAVIYPEDGDSVRLVKSLTGGLGADVSIECVGNPETPQLAVNLTRKTGITVLTGVFDKSSTFNFISIVGDEKTVVGSPIYAGEGKTAVAWLRDGRIDPRRLITSVAPLKDTVELGFEKLLKNKETEIKVLLKP